MTSAVVLRRGDVVESVHRVNASVADGEGRPVARVGDADRVAGLRSAAKPLQALPLVADGVVDAFRIPEAELALCCASHSGEPRHVGGVRRLLARCGIPEEALECGPHLPLSEAATRALLGAEEGARPIHNNCSGKHAGMLALARHRDWPASGYRLEGHPVQRRMLAEVARWCAVSPGEIRLGVDGCGVLCFGVPLASAARAFAALGAAAGRGEAGPAAVSRAMGRCPEMVGGSGRLCTRLMEATGGTVLAKVGAEGVYGAWDLEGRWGIALKVEDGARRAAEVALMRILELLGALPDPALALADEFRRRPVRNTRGEPAAHLEAVVELVGGGALGAEAREAP